MTLFFYANLSNYLRFVVYTLILQTSKALRGIFFSHSIGMGLCWNTCSGRYVRPDALVEVDITLMLASQGGKKGDYS